MKPILNLNKHPKDCENLSLVEAINVRLSNDGSCLQTEEAIVDIKTINDQLNSDYNNNFNIIDTISCNKELIIFVKNLLQPKPLADFTIYNTIDIYRYNEDLNIIKKVYSNLNYHNGRIKGAFTYNVHNELIIAFSEYDGYEDVPLRTINLGKFEDEVEQLPNALLPINPEVYIPTLFSYDYITGNLPKGWYHIFIRYKIDNNDYTKWFDLGGDILVNDIEKQSIFKLYGYYKDEIDKPFSTGALDYFSTNHDITNETLKLDLSYIDNRYKYYQIGFICHNTTNIISYSSFDIKTSDTTYILNIEKMYQIDYNELLIDNYNPLNVKSIINHKNRLYVSNYKESLLKDYDTSNIKINLINNKKEYSDIYNQSYEGNVEDSLPYRTITKDSQGVLPDIFNNDSASPIIVSNLNIDGKIYNTLIESDSGKIELRTNGTMYTIKCVDEKGNVKPQCKYKDFILYINDTFKILTTNGNVLNIDFFVKFLVTPHIEFASPENIVEFSYTINNKVYKAVGKVFSWGNNTFEFYIHKSDITSDILIPTNVDEDANVRYINTKNSYNNRRKETSLIPGEVYNFYIHFVDKYGFETKGFKINPIKQLSYGVPILINHPNWKYVLMKENVNVFNEAGDIDLTYKDNCWGVFNTLSHYKWKNSLVASGACAAGSTIVEIEQILKNLYGNLNKNKELKWEDLSVGNLEGFVFNTEDDYINSDFNIKDIVTIPIYLPYYNKNGEKYFKIPYIPIKSKIVNGNVVYEYPNIGISVENVEIPEGYVGYFISYEKLEESSKITGILTKYDYNDKDYDENNDLTNYNKSVGNKMYFYASDFDILDKVDINYNVLRIESKNSITPSQNYNTIENSIIESVANLNVPQNKDDENFNPKYIEISNYNILVGGDAIKNRFGLGTCLEIDIDSTLFPDGEYNIYKASLLNINNDKYSSNDKKLIKCTNIIYPDINKEQNIIQYLNGRNTYNSFLIYDNNKFIYDDARNRVIGENEKVYIGYGDGASTSDENKAKLLTYVQIPVYQQYFYETKSFKNKPTNIAFKINSNETEVNVQLGLVVKPQNSIDLFENKFVHPDDYCPKFYTNNRTDIKYLTQFDKIVRRSDVIQDESSSNAWRQFGLENYKVISENKGKITNIVGIGYYFIVHTEHSLFAFNNDNKLSALDKEIQLTTPDIFDIDYQEILTSNLGYGGLQNNDDWVLGTFGYIYYDKDSNRIFRFDNGKLDYIDNDIVQFLNKYKPKYIHFADDTKSNRILLDININDNRGNYSIELSYNYGINKFISTHIYAIQKVANTKNNLYLVYDDKISKFDYDAVLRNEGYTTNDSTLSFIINERYQSIKYLEYIIYKLYNVKVNTDDYTSDNNLPPVEELRKPYSGEQIRVYNDEVDTGWLDIHISEEESKNIFANYNKPYWEKGNWNFSYLRDKNTKSRLYGNYFVVSIKFKGLGERIEFESLLYSISKERL